MLCRKSGRLSRGLRPKLEPAIPFIDTILETDVNAPRKQRHTARRIFDRLRMEKPSIEVAEATVRAYVREKKLKIGLIHREIFVPQSYTLGQEGQVDWYEIFAELGGERQKVQIFCLRSMGSAGAFHPGRYRSLSAASWPRSRSRAERVPGFWNKMPIPPDR
jgi:hypothetical protein